MARTRGRASAFTASTRYEAITTPVAISNNGGTVLRTSHCEATPGSPCSSGSLLTRAPAAPSQAAAEGIRLLRLWRLDQPSPATLGGAACILLDAADLIPRSGRRPSGPRPSRRVSGIDADPLGRRTDIVVGLPLALSAFQRTVANSGDRSSSRCRTRVGRSLAPHLGQASIREDYPFVDRRVPSRRTCSPPRSREVSPHSPRPERSAQGRSAARPGPLSVSRDRRRMRPRRMEAA